MKSKVICFFLLCLTGRTTGKFLAARGLTQRWRGAGSPAPAQLWAAGAGPACASLAPARPVPGLLWKASR